MKFFCIILLLASGSLVVRSQTFTGPGGVIPDNGAFQTCFPVSVSGVGNINGSYGLGSVCINITHGYDGDLNIFLKAPDGTTVPLSMQNGSSGDNYTNTCFLPGAVILISGGTPPFTGSFIPNGDAGLVNNGQNANGNWYICIQDGFPGFTGSLVNFTLTFNNAPFISPPVIPACAGNLPASDDCIQATTVCNFAGYCGSTSADYTINTWPELTSTFCGSIENNSFLSFKANDDTASFNLWVYNSLYALGIQMMIFSGDCGLGPVTVHGCYSQVFPSPYATIISATGLTVGNTYYVMIDGFGGDVCDFTMAAVSGLNTQVTTLDYPDSVACISSAAALVPLITGQAGGVFSASPAGLNINANTGNIIPNQSTAGNYNVSYSSSGTGSCQQVTSVSTAAVRIFGIADHIWTGAVNSAWENPANWSCGNVPVNTTDVVINTGVVLISSNVIINSLTINPNVVLTVAPGYNLTLLH
ncbi:MAG: proprotein convertase P-domain-containing protein [Ferruginibacter sp.]|nr:proprotein convertase P-domain-containing protein [Ferruginibacter sp.]